MEISQVQDGHKEFALVTGASQGLGRSIAFELAKRRIHLLLTALPEEGLPTLAEQLKGNGIEVHFFETDLSNKENIQRLADWAAGYPLFALFNNAGRGGTQHFLDVTADYLDSIIQLNIRATSLLTHHLLPNLKKRQQAFILNIGSMAALRPMGYKTVYPASKSFVLHFSLGLREELKGTGVSVSVLLPGAMKTNEDVSRRIEKQGFLGKMGVLPTERIAEIAVRGMLKGKAEIVPGWVNCLTAKLLGIMPKRWAIGLLTRTMRREVSHL